MYKKHSRFRLSLLSLILTNPEISKYSYRALRHRVLWDMYYLLFNVKNIVKPMIAEDLTSSIVHRKNGTKTIFIYFSSTESIVKNKQREDKAFLHEYSHMISDYVVSSRVSNNNFRTQECSIGKYIDNGPIFRDIINEVQKEKFAFRKKLGLPEKSTIVSFFDHSIGHIGVLDTKAYKLFLNAILLFSQKYHDIFFIYKSKKDISQINDISGFDADEVLTQLISKENCLCNPDITLSSLELIGISDLVISAPVSSVIYESLSSGTKTISFDPCSRYEGFDNPSNQIPKLSAYSQDELEVLLKYWLFDTSKTEFKEYLDEYLLPYIDIDNGKSCIQEFQSFLKEC